MLPLIIIHFFCLFNRIRGHDLKGFDDTILFDIDWRDDFFFVNEFLIIYYKLY